MDEIEVPEWPYGLDADHNDPLTKHRIAVTNSHPMPSFLVSFDRESEARPTERETAQMVAYLDHYKQRWYNDWLVQRLAQKPLDVDDSANGIVFHKWADDDWGYRRQSFSEGHLFTIPAPLIRHRYPQIKAPVSLEELLDNHVYRLNETWLQWKLTRPEAFDAQG